MRINPNHEEGNNYKDKEQKKCTTTGSCSSAGKAK